MCLGTPKPPPLPEPQPTAPRPEKTADKVVVGTKRTKKQKQQAKAPMRLGTQSLQIPLLDGTRTKGNNLRY